MTRALAHRQPVQVMVLVRHDREIRHVEFVYQLAVTLTLLISILAALLVFDKYAAGLNSYLAGWWVDLQVIAWAATLFVRDYGGYHGRI